MKHVVIIEDDLDLLDILGIMLIEAGYRVTKLTHMESVEQLIDMQADAFVIDEMLPVVNGHIICIILKSKPQTKHLPVVLISGDEKLPQMATLCEANAYLHKPFNSYKDLQRILEKALAA